MNKTKLLLPLLGVSTLTGVSMPLFSCGQSDKLNFTVNNVKGLSDTHATLELDWTPSDHSVEFSNFKFKYNNNALEATNVEMFDATSRPLNIALTFASGALSEKITDGVLSFHCKDKTISKEYDTSVDNIIVEVEQPTEPDDIISGDFSCSGHGTAKDKDGNEKEFHFDQNGFETVCGEFGIDKSGEEDDKFLKVLNIFNYSEDKTHEYELKFSFKYFEKFNPELVTEEKQIDDGVPVVQINTELDISDFVFPNFYESDSLDTDNDTDNKLHISSITLNGKTPVEKLNIDDINATNANNFPSAAWRYKVSGEPQDGDSTVLIIGNGLTKNDWLDIKFTCTNPERNGYLGCLFLSGGFKV